MGIMAIIVFAIIGMVCTALAIITAVSLIWYGWRKNRRRRRSDKR